MPSTVTSILDGLSTSVAVKAPCRTVATTNITLSGLQTISGYTTVENDRILVKGQTDAVENGIYMASTGTWTRAKDADGNRDLVQGTRVIVRSTTADGVEYELTTANPIVIDTTAQTWELRYGANATYDQTEAEIAAGVTPTNYGYQPGDVRRYGASASASASTNVTAINNALSSNSYVSFIDPGTYVVNDNLDVQSNTHVYMAPGVIIQGAASGSWAALPDTGIFDLDGVDKVTIQGGDIDGNKANNAVGRIFGVRVFDSTNVTLIDVIARNCPASDATGINGGDGFVIYGTSANFIMRGCRAFDNVRQGLSLVAVDGFIVSDFIARDTTGSAPGAGIDIEADPGGDDLEDGVLTNIVLEGNYDGLIVTTACQRVICSNIVSRENRSKDVFVGDGAKIVINGLITFGGQTIAGSANVQLIGFEDVTISNFQLHCSQNSNGRQGILANYGKRLKLSNGRILNSYRAGLQLGATDMTADLEDAEVTDVTLHDCVEAGAASIASAIVTGNSGSGFYPLRVTIDQLKVVDSRSGGNEADSGFEIATAIPAATAAQYRVNRLFVSGPAAVITAGTSLPLRGSASWNPGSIADGDEEETTVTVTGVALGDFVDSVSFDLDISDLTLTAAVTAANTVSVTLANNTGGAVDLGAGTVRVKCSKRDE